MCRTDIIECCLSRPWKPGLHMWLRKVCQLVFILLFIVEASSRFHPSTGPLQIKNNGREIPPMSARMGMFRPSDRLLWLCSAFSSDRVCWLCENYVGWTTPGKDEPQLKIRSEGNWIAYRSHPWVLFEKRAHFCRGVSPWWSCSHRQCFRQMCTRSGSTRSVEKYSHLFLALYVASSHCDGIQRR